MRAESLLTYLLLPQYLFVFLYNYVRMVFVSSQMLVPSHKLVPIKFWNYNPKGTIAKNELDTWIMWWK